MKITLLTVFFLISVIGFSQKDSLNPLGYGKHSVSTNLSTILPALIGAKRQSINSYNIQYRRTLKNFNLKASGNYYASHIKYSEPNNGVLAITDTTILTRNTQGGTTSSKISLGIEKRFGKKRINWMIGLDVIVGKRNDFMIYSDHIQVNDVDSAGNLIGAQFLISDPNANPYEITELGAVLGYRSADYLQIGLDINFGIEFQLSKRFNLTTQFAPKLIYNKTQTLKTEDAKSYLKYYPFNSYTNFAMGYLQINLSYKFGGMKDNKG